MNGLGIYVYTDGVRYEGQYQTDKKEGYGTYLWPDNRKYEGWWHNGVKHGLGIYQDARKKFLYGLWENGKQVKRYGEETVDKIQNLRHDFRADFTDPQSANGIRNRK